MKNQKMEEQAEKKHSLSINKRYICMDLTNHDRLGMEQVRGVFASGGDGGEGGFN